MAKRHNQLDDTLEGNLALLQALWNRRPFHDMALESITRTGGRVLFQLTDYLLVLLRVAEFTEDIEEFPTAWIDQQITLSESKATLRLEAELGSVTVRFRNLRLFKTPDMTILIPNID